MTNKILCVDDDQSILDGFQRQLRKSVDLTTRTNGDDGLKVIQEEGPFAVVVSDMQMPGMDGIRFLAKVKEISPDSVRIMLTGNADQQTAMNAVNEGNIFRFLTKPCAAEVLLKAIEGGIAQYRLITAEKELLEKTLNGSIQVLVDVISLTNPIAFSRAMRLRRYVGQIGKALGLADIWQLEVAAMLSHIGCVTIPSETLEKHAAGEDLSSAEKNMMAAFPDIGSKLIAKVPRLETVAGIIAKQQDPGAWPSDPLQASDVVRTGAAILRAATDFDQWLSRGLSRVAATEKMAAHPEFYAPALIAALRTIEVAKVEMRVAMMPIADLRNGMIINEDIRSTKGVLVLPKGHEVNDAIRQRLVNFHMQGAIQNSVRVSVPSQVFSVPL